MATIKKATSVTAWNDATGKRISVKVSEIDIETGRIVSDQKRIDRIVLDPEGESMINALLAYAQAFVNSAEI